MKAQVRQTESPGESPADGAGATARASRSAAEPTPNLRHRVIESLLALSTTAAIGQVANLAATLLLARILAPADFGAISVATLVINAFSLLRNAFVFQTLIHRRGRVREAADQMLLLATALGAALCLAVWIGGDWIGAYFRSPGSVLVMRLMALAFLIGSIGAIPDTLFEKDLRFRAKMWLESAKPALAALASVLLALWGLGAASVGWGQLAGAVLWTAGMFRLSDYRPHLHLDLPLLRELLDYGRFVFGGALLVFLFSNLDNASVARILGGRALGFYSFAFLLAYMPAEVFTAGIVSSILLPVYARLQDQREAQARAFVGALRYVGYYAAPICAGTVVLGPPALRLVYGAKWAPMLAALQVLALYGFAHSYFLVVRNLCNGVGRARGFWRVSALQLALVLPLLIMAPARFGITGTSLLFTASKIITAVVALWYAAHITGLAPRRLARPLGLPLGASTVAGLAAFALSGLLTRDKAHPTWLALALEVIVFAAIYVTIMLRVDAAMRAEARRLIAQASALGRQAYRTLHRALPLGVSGRLDRLIAGAAMRSVAMLERTRPLSHRAVVWRNRLADMLARTLALAWASRGAPGANNARSASVATIAPPQVDVRQDASQEKAMPAPRVLIIGMDGATFRVIDPLIEEGKLPHLARLLRGGLRANLLSTIPYHTSAAWPTFLTGLHPGSHGIFNFDEMSAGGYGAGARLVTSAAIAGRTFLDVAGKAGLRVAAVRIPMTYPAWPVNGALVSGYPSPERGAYVYPRAMAERVPGMRDPSDAPDPDARARLLLDEVSRTTEIACHILATDHPDLCAVVYQQSDVAHHWFWRYMDPASPAYSPDEAARYGDVIARVYAAIDEGIGALLRHADAATRVMVLSDHGGTLGPSQQFHINAWLAAEGLLARREPSAAAKAYALRRYVLPPAARARLKRIVNRVLPRTAADAAELLYFNLQDVAWERTQAFRFAVTAEVEGIRLNVAGRERHGIVAPGAEQDALRERLIARLAALRAPLDGAPLVRAIYRREELYTGERAGGAPDLILLLHPAYRGGRELNGPLFSAVPMDELRRNHGGWHEPEGILIAHGPGIAHGTLESARLLDMAPTVLGMVGLPAAPWMEGAALREVAGATIAPLASVASRSQVRDEPVPTATSANASRAAVPLTPDEEESVRERLRSLGYL